MKSPGRRTRKSGKVARPTYPDIEVHLPFNLSLIRGVLEGVTRFRIEHPELAVQIHDYGDGLPETRHCRGIITFGGGLLRTCLGKEVRAAVNLSNRNNPLPTHSVVNDDYEVGRLAADHLADRGFPYFGFVGLEGLYFSTLRHAGFQERLRERLKSTALRVPDFSQAGGKIVFSDISTPCGILAANDHIAARAVDVAIDAGFRIPSDIAILGVDDDPIRCAMSRVELSSIRVNSVAHGYEAMGLVLELLHKRRPPARTIIRRILPLGITTRRSTDTFAHPNPAVVAVLEVLRDRIHTIDGVEGLARACGMGTRTLERLFRDHLRSNPRAELAASRFRLARDLLMQSSLTVNEVAERAGYADVRTLICQCKRQTGLTPGAFRKQFAV